MGGVGAARDHRGSACHTGLWNPEWTSHGPFLEKVKDRLAQPPVPGGSGGAGQSITFIGATPLGHPLAPILANWLDNHMFVASTLIGFTVIERIVMQ